VFEDQSSILFFCVQFCSVWKKLDYLILPSRIFIYLLFPSNSGLEDMLYCVNFDVKDCNMFVNLNYARSCVLIISYPFHVLFMQICMCECLKIIGVYFLINMLRLEKPDVSVFVVLLTKPNDPVSHTGLSGFDRLSICFSKF
jgi:hypothetical protein